MTSQRLAAVTTFHGWRALRHRNYRLFFFGQMISLVGTWMQSVAQAWLVLTLTNDPFYLGLISAAQFGPVLFLGLFGGLVADAFPKRLTLLATQTTSMLLAFVLFGLSVTGLVQVWMIILLALLLGFVNSADMPTRQAFSVEMVGREDVGNAIALNSAVFNVARIAGPAVAGLTIGAWGVPAAFLVNGLSFLAVIAAYLLMAETELAMAPRMPRPRSIREVGANLAEGLGYVRRTPLILLSISVVGLVSTFGMNFGVIVPAFARLVLGTDAEGYGFLMAAMGIGSLLASLWLAFASRTRPVTILWGAILLGAAQVALAATRSYPVSLAGMFAVGLGGVAMAMTANTTIQMIVPDHLRGRVMSVHTTAFVGSTPIGGLIIGTIASGVSVPAALAIGGAVSVGVAGVGLLRYRTLHAAGMAEAVSTR